MRNPEKQFLPVKDGVKCLCPYCRKTFVWPPSEMRCPECGKTVRPPPDHALPGREKRRRIVEKIQNDHDAKLVKMGPAPSFKTSEKARMFLGIIAACAVVLSVVGVMSSRKTAPPPPRTDTITQTRSDMKFYATALEHFKLDIGRYPTASGDGGLLALIQDPGEPDWAGPYAPIIRKDGWRRSYFYDCTNGIPVLMSAGPDRIFNTADDFVATPDDFKPHPGFIPNDPDRISKRPPPPVNLQR